MGQFQEREKYANRVAFKQALSGNRFWRGWGGGGVTRNGYDASSKRGGGDYNQQPAKIKILFYTNREKICREIKS